MPKSVDLEQKLMNEKKHGELLSKRGAEEIWNWASPAGRRRAHRRAGFFLQCLKPGIKSLEIGCGTGYFTRLIAGSGAAVTAVDISQDLLDQARDQTNAPNVFFEIADVHHLKYDTGIFDVVFGSSVLHHLEVKTALREIFRVLKPGGTMIFAEPNMLNPQIWAERNIPCIRRKVGASPDETAFVRFRLARMMRDIGFQNISIVPHDFLHPSVPENFISIIERLSRILEWLPLICEIAGSLAIRGEKPLAE